MNKSLQEFTSQGVSSNDPRVVALVKQRTALQQTFAGLTDQLTSIRLNEYEQEPLLSLEQQASPDSATRQPSQRAVLLAGAIAGFVLGFFLAARLIDRRDRRAALLAGEKIEEIYV